MAASKDLEIIQGKTFSYVARWETTPIVYRPITGISNTAPCAVTCPMHGLTSGWRVAVVSTKGMDQLRAPKQPPRERDYHRVTVLSSSLVELNDVNAADFSAYRSGGYLQFNMPVELSGFTARMAIKDRVGGTVLHSLTTENGGITIDTSALKTTVLISAEDTAAFSWKKGVYDLEMVGPDGVVTLLLYGAVAITTEVTT